MVEAGTSFKGDAGLTQALRAARQAEAAHFEAVAALRDAKSIRLLLLKDDLVPAVQSLPGAQHLFDLAVNSGDSPRLWIDLITYVVMEPEPRVYRLMEDRQSGREILFESEDRAHMAERVREIMAHRLVSRERQVASATSISMSPGFSTSSMILAWLAGFALGALALLAVAMSLGKIEF
ncbi:MAG: hypothetical protein U1F47_02965 [Hyphomicrobiales bacterium]